MAEPQMKVTPAKEADSSGVVGLIVDQEKRWYDLDSGLGQPRAMREIASMVDNHLRDGEDPPLVVLNTDGRVRGYVKPSLLELPADSDLLAYFRSRNGMYKSLVLPPPGDNDAKAVLETLVTALTDFWRSRSTLADMVPWPSRDTWVEQSLFVEGFAPEHVFNYRLPGPLPPAASPPAIDVAVRLAKPSDEDQLVSLNRANVAFDASHSSVIKVVPTLEPALRKELARVWVGQSVEDGVPLVVVVEHHNKIVGMAQSYLVTTPGLGAIGTLPSGRYAYLHEVIVLPDMRGNGIGRMLLQGIFDAFAKLHVDAYTLYFNPHNPLSSAFWPHVGFRPIWTVYMRLNRP